MEFGRVHSRSQDLSDDGVVSWSGTPPAGAYEFKVAHGLSWDENYGAGGVRDGANISVSVPSDGVVLTIDYTLSSHEVRTTLSRAGAGGAVAGVGRLRR